MGSQKTRKSRVKGCLLGRAPESRRTAVPSTDGRRKIPQSPGLDKDLQAVIDG